MKTSLFLAALARGAAENASPLGQVFKLMDELSAKITAEGEEEAKQYREYFEWCDDVNKNSHFAIKTAQSQKDKLEASIGELNANIVAGSSKIEDLAAAISSASTELEEATAIRKNEKKEFMTAEHELVDSLDTLDRAIKIISKEMEKNPSFAQQTSKGFTAMLQGLTTVVEAAGFSADDKKRLTALVESESDSKQDDVDLDFGAPAAAAYESKSGGIVDTLEDLREKAQAELGDLRKAETANKHNYDMLAQSLNDSLAADNKELTDEKTGKAANEESLATAKSDLSVTVKTLENGKEELDVANNNCMRVAADHGATVRAREEELKVIAEARKIIKEATAGGASFLQISTSAELAEIEIITIVKKLARTQHSATLSQLASRISAVMRFGSSQGEDPFVKVKAMITDMISKLEEEAAAEANEKAYCDEEMAKTETKKGELDAVVAKLSSKINQDSARSAELKSEVKELQASLAALASEQAGMDKMRQEAHADYVKAKDDLTQGLAGIGKALSVLREYYGAASSALIQQPAAPATHGKAAGAGESIINLLEVCEEDFASDLAKVEAEEASRAEAYEQNTQENKLLKTTSESDVKYKSQEATSLDKTLTELKSDRSTSQTELDAVNDYYSGLRGRCIAKPETYEEKKRRREAEINGLKEAMSILDNQSAFVQRGKRQHGRHMRGSMHLR